VYQKANPADFNHTGELASVVEQMENSTVMYQSASVLHLYHPDP